MTKPVLRLVGPEEGGPTLEDLLALAEQITGREATPEEVEEARQILLDKTAEPL